MSLETQSHVKGFDVVAFSISFETDYLNMADASAIRHSGLGCVDRK